MSNCTRREQYGRGSETGDTPRAFNGTSYSPYAAENSGVMQQPVGADANGCTNGRDRYPPTRGFEGP